MRVKAKELAFLRGTLMDMCPEGEIFLFGSRTDDRARGGDIDILWLSPQGV